MLESILLALALQCAPHVSADTVMRVITVEAAPQGAGYNPFSLNISGIDLRRQPNSAKESIAIAQHYIDKGHNVDMGLMQISSQNLPGFGLTVNEIFNPCTNMATGASILTTFYKKTNDQLQQRDRLLLALSAYNTGSFTAGFTNGYVDRYFNYIQLHHK